MFCEHTFSGATGHEYCRSRRRDLHAMLPFEVGSAKTLRRIAVQYRAARSTVLRAVERVARHLDAQLVRQLLSYEPLSIVYFDEVESFIHTRWKPVSIAMVVGGDRRILGVRLAETPARGRHAARAREKYGWRKDRRPQVRRVLGEYVRPALRIDVTIKTDEHPAYRRLWRQLMPSADHQQFKGRRARRQGYGELKVGGFDPLFVINHTAAMLRDNIKVLSRRTWCTAKCLRGLERVLIIYQYYHNNYLLRPPPASP